MVNPATTEFDVELCHAFFSAVVGSDLICMPCKEGLIQRYFHSKGRNDLIFKVYRRMNELDQPLFVRVMHDLGGPDDFQRAIQDLNDVPHLYQVPDATGAKQWDCVNNADWGDLNIWLRILAKEESIIPHPLKNRDYKTSAWRSRAWAATAGRYTLDDLRDGRSIQRFLYDHQAYLLESSLWPADARIPRLAKYEITPAACKCFSLGQDGTATFQDTIQALSRTPEALRNPRYIHIHRKAIISRLVGGCFVPEIVEGVLQRCVPPAMSDTADPFQTFTAYWDSAPVRQAVTSLLGLTPETCSDAPAPARAKGVREPEWKTSNKPLSMRRGVTIKHPAVEIGHQVYHPLAPRPGIEGPVDYEGEARKIRTRHDADSEEWFDRQYQMMV